MKFSLNIPIDHIEPKAEFQSASALREMAIAIERAGADACWITDHPAPETEWLHKDPTGHDTLDPFTALAFIAAATIRLKLVTHVVVLPYRNPFLTAKAAATLQILSENRLILGVGAGYQKAEFDALGVSFAERGVLTDEALETIRLAWRGGAVAKKGLHFDAKGNEPRPVPSPQPPIWVGGGSHKALQRAATFGDGWIPFFTLPTSDPEVAKSWVGSVDELKEKITLLKTLRSKAGKTGPFDVCISAPYRLKENTSSEAERYCEAVQKLAEIGVTWIDFRPGPQSRAAYLENVAWFGEEVISRLRR